MTFAFSAQPFIQENFLLDTDVAQGLYHEVARDLPIIDYHCHLPPEQVADDHQFRSLSEIWLDGDHYKWRAMRANGIPEACCTGGASDWQKFQAWAKTVPATLRNPLFHWTHLELAFPFGIRDRLLNPETAGEIYEQCNAQLQLPEFSAQGLLRQFNVKVVCTTDDPVDSLEPHLRHARKGAVSTQLLPTWRPDAAMAVGDSKAYALWLEKLEACSNTSVSSYADLITALDIRHQFFHDAGCRLSDRGLDTIPRFASSEQEAAQIFTKARNNRAITEGEQEGFRGRLLHDLGLMDHKRNWVMQLHMGALRSVNTRLVGKVGINTGFDSIGDSLMAAPLARLLDALDKTDQLPRTILYNLNPRDNEMVATMAGNFQDGSVAGKIQFGSAWWFLDQLDGMTRQLDALSNQGLLSRFVGMLTDSRSFLSYSRHDYFRRLFCNLLGTDVQRGLLPNDPKLLGELVRGVCFENAQQYFCFDD